MKMIETINKKIVCSENYNSVFNKFTGFFARWGNTNKQNPIMAPLPEILDLEISSGKCLGNCPECYKCNGKDKSLHNMSFYDFAVIFHRLTKTIIEIDDVRYDYNINFSCFGVADTKGKVYGFLQEIFPEAKKIKIYNEGLLTQIAFGICDIHSNPSFLKMMKYARSFGVIPNYTCHGFDMTEEFAIRSAKICGAVAVSYHNKDACYNSIKLLTDAGMKQVNIHYVIHDKSYDEVFKVINDITMDERLKGLNALVLLRYKPKGNNKDKYKQITLEQYKNIIDYAKDKINIGFDSCSANMYLQTLDKEEYERKVLYAEPCESSLFSAYINVKGEFYPCSFCEGENNWETGISVLDKDFNKIWYNKNVEQFRDSLLRCNRNCPIFNFKEN